MITNRRVFGFLSLILPCATAFAGVLLDVPYIEQPDDQTCLPTCLTMTLHYHGKAELTSNTIQALHRRTKYDRYNLPGILADYGLFGLPNWYELAWSPDLVRQELDAGRPVILGVNQGRYGHFVLAVGYTDDGRVILNDPTKQSPGYPLGGEKQAYAWDKLNWRGGCVVRKEDFVTTPSFSGKLVKITAPARLKCGEEGDSETSQVIVELRNTGSQAWPEVTLRPIDLDTSPLRVASKSLHVGPKDEGKIGVRPVKQGILPGETTTFTLELQAPHVTRATSIREYWTLFSKDSEFPAGTYMVGPGPREISFVTVVEPHSSAALPLQEMGTPSVPSLPWNLKFGSFSSDTKTTGIPNELPVFSLKASESGYNTAWVGNPDWRDYAVEAWVYCDLRKELATDGWERYGVFMRDNGMHAADTRNAVEVGECITMCFDTDDGSLRAGNIINGGVEDFRPKSQRHRLKESGWHKFAIRCSGDRILFELDGKLFHEQKDASLMEGDCGVFCKSAFLTPTNGRGVSFAGFKCQK